MILSAVTVSLVPEASGGPFVFHGDLQDACHTAAQNGFDAIEIFAPSGHHLEVRPLQDLLKKNRLLLAAVGTGAGMIVHGHSLSAGDRRERERACDFVREIIDFGSHFGAPAIIGSMQGKASSQQQSRDAGLETLAASLRTLAGHAASRGQRLLFEPLNRYETDLVNTLADGAELIDRVGASNLKLLADLFHMNIEEASIEAAIGSAAPHVGHVHFVDTNRRAAGLGHMQYEPIAQALIDADYDGYASAEAFPLPDALTAAESTIGSFRKLFRN